MTNPVPTPRPRVFVHTNERQWIGALVSRYSMYRQSAHPDAFDVEFLHTRDHPWIRAREGQLYLREGDRVVWRYDDLQSFTPLRFLPPEKMGYEGRAVVVDPDVFAVGDVFELLSRELGGRAIACRRRTGSKGAMGGFASSVMLLDCARLRHWRAREQFEELFAGTRDYMDWICLQTERPETIALFENEWNDFDRLTPKTRLIHNTKRQTQPWKTGLPVDYRPADTFRLFPPRHWIRRARRALFGDYRFAGRYHRHPDPRQEQFFFGLLAECMEKGIVDEQRLREEMRLNHVRHDALDVLSRTPPLAA